MESKFPVEAVSNATAVLGMLRNYLNNVDSVEKSNGQFCKLSMPASMVGRLDRFPRYRIMREMVVTFEQQECVVFFVTFNFCDWLKGKGLLPDKEYRLVCFWRTLIGLPETRSKKYLLDIDFRQRETFAYACEAYSRILELSDNPKGRIGLCTELLEEYEPPDAQVDLEKYQSSLIAACNARNGWKKILDVCTPRRGDK